MKFYRLQNKEVNWGDYGDMLLSGTTTHLDRHQGLLQYIRTGPFQPDITISGIDDLLVTEGIKKKIGVSNLQGFQFRPVIKRHIPFLDWTSRNIKNKDPGYYPDNGEPEKYILSLQHSEELAANMENIWEVIVDISGTFADSQTYKQGEKNIDIMMTRDSGWFVVAEKAKLWMEDNCDNWTEFWDLDDLSN